MKGSSETLYIGLSRMYIMSSVIHPPFVSIDADVQKLAKAGLQEFGQVTIHGTCRGGAWGTAIRIWPTTYLFDCQSAHVSDLVYFERISPYPLWTPVLPNQTLNFTLIFSGLPSPCNVFDLHEVIPESDGFYIPAIQRNEQDVYYLDFSA